MGCLGQVRGTSTPPSSSFDGKVYRVQPRYAAMGKQEKTVDDKSWVGLGNNLPVGICNQQMRRRLPLSLNRFLSLQLPAYFKYREVQPPSSFGGMGCLPEISRDFEGSHYRLGKGCPFSRG